MIYTANTWGETNRMKGIKCFTDYDKFKDPRRNAKIYKVLSHLFIETEHSIWIDANVELKVPYRTLIGLLGDKDIAVFKHTDRDNINDEAHVCQQWNKDDYDTIQEQIERYNYKEKGLGACFILIRRHTEKIKRLNEQWWAEICRGSVRDQISFPYVFRDNVRYIEIDNMLDNKYFKRYGH